MKIMRILDFVHPLARKKKDYNSMETYFNKLTNIHTLVTKIDKLEDIPLYVKKYYCKNEECKNQTKNNGVCVNIEL